MQLLTSKKLGLASCTLATAVFSGAADRASAALINPDPPTQAGAFDGGPFAPLSDVARGLKSGWVAAVHNGTTPCDTLELYLVGVDQAGSTQQLSSLTVTKSVVPGSGPLSEATVNGLIADSTVVLGSEQMPVAPDTVFGIKQWVSLSLGDLSRPADGEYSIVLKFPDFQPLNGDPGVDLYVQGAIGIGTFTGDFIHVDNSLFPGGTGTVQSIVGGDVIGSFSSAPEPGAIALLGAFTGVALARRVRR